MLEMTSRSYTIQTTHLYESGLLGKFTSYKLYRKSQIRKHINEFLDGLHLDFIQRKELKDIIFQYSHCIEMDIESKYDDRIDKVLIGKYLKDCLDRLASLGFDCNKRHEVYEFVNQFYKDYYKNCMKTTCLYFGGMTTYMQ